MVLIMCDKCGVGATTYIRISTNRYVTVNGYLEELKFKRDLCEDCFKDLKRYLKL